jgi:hypothetical protein
MRVAEDGKPYTYEEFIEFFGNEKGKTALERRT